MPRVLLVSAVWVLVSAPVFSQGLADQRNGEPAAQFAERYLQQYDKNNDGVLRQDEWGSSSLLNRETDTDANGEITKDELVQRLTSRLRSSSGSPLPRPIDRGASRPNLAADPPAADLKPVAASPSPRVDVPAVDGPAERVLVFTRHASASSIADVLNKHFESSEKPQVRVVADLVSNSLLITATPDLLQEVVSLVEQLDRPPATIQLEILVVERTEREPAAVAGAPSRTTAEQAAEEALQTGPAEDVLARIQRWESEGKISVLHRLKLSTVENQKALVQIGQTKPVVQGMSFSSRGESRNVTNHNVGLLVAATPRASGEQAVITELQFEKSDIVAHPSDPPLATTSAGEKVPSTRIVTSTAKTSVTIPRGQAIVLADVSTIGSGEQNRLVLVVTAGVSGAAGKKRD